MTVSSVSFHDGLAGESTSAIRNRAVEAFALERNIVAVSGAVFLLALGENFWKRFIPKYLEALGAPVTAIGLFGACQDLLDGVYQYPGGWIGDRYGRRRALVLFVGLAMLGYGLYWWAPTWPFVFAGLVFVMAWSSMASPTLFAVVGDALPEERRALGFTVQSILRRIPIAVAPTLGGLAIAAYGVLGGVHLGLALTVALAAVTLAAVWRVNIPVTRDEARRTSGGLAVATRAAPLAPRLRHLHPDVRGTRRRLPRPVRHQHRGDQRPGVRRPHRGPGRPPQSSAICRPPGLPTASDASRS